MFINYEGDNTIMEKLDLRVHKTYKSLIENFEELLQEKKFEKISVKEICDAAMIRRPTFYKHFLDKYDFLTFFIKYKMDIIFDYAFENINDKKDNFFILVFEQLLNQPDNVLYLIFSLQLNADIIIELEGVQEYGQNMLKNHVHSGNTDSSTAIEADYKGQIIMGITIQSVYWYKKNQDKTSQEDVIKFYKKTLENIFI